jgi:hypothetical protein
MLLCISLFIDLQILKCDVTILKVSSSVLKTTQKKMFFCWVLAKFQKATSFKYGDNEFDNGANRLELSQE